MPRKAEKWNTRAARRFRALQSVPESVRAKTKPAIERSAKQINELQKRLVPVRTGALRSRIGYKFGDAPQTVTSASFSSSGRGKVQGDKDLRAFLYAGVEDKTQSGWYARFVEFGTAPRGDHPGTKPQPFFYPAIRLLRKSVKRNIATAFNKGLKEAGIRSNKPRGATAK